VSVTFQELLEKARRLREVGPRALLGIAGSPGSGKSTLAAALVSALGPDAVALGMDGFHLDDAELRRLGRLERKGAPDTFDIDGYLALLRRIRSRGAGTVYAPRFDRSLGVSLAGAVPVEERHRLIVTEGNYLLLRRPGWRQVRSYLDEVWFLDIDPTTRRSRLIARRTTIGDAHEEALDWVCGVDEPNADLVQSDRDLADFLITVADLFPEEVPVTSETKGEGVVL
jgi:pantothenate kinase